MVVVKRSEIEIAMQDIAQTDLVYDETCSWLSEDRLAEMYQEIEAELDQLCDQLL